MTNPGVQPIVEATAGLESLITGLYEKSGNSGLTREQFAAILNQVAVKYLPAAASASETAELYASLRVEELALARACAAGQERAWEIFMARYREKLYDIAAHIARETSVARELADSLYADLYGTSTRDGQRVSKLASYTGRGSLEGWLRTVMAQEFKPGEIVPQSGIYTITHDAAHADMPHEVTVIKGRRFPTCRHRKGVRFELAHAARHVGEIDHFERRMRRHSNPIPAWRGR